MTKRGSEWGFYFKSTPCLGKFNGGREQVLIMMHLTSWTDWQDGPCVVEAITISRAVGVWYACVSALCLCMGLNVCLRTLVCVWCCELSASSGPTPRRIAHCNGCTQKEIEEEEGLPFLPFLFIFFDFSLDISVTLFLKLRNTLLEVWVEGNGRQRGWRQDTDLNCDDSLGFLPLTSSTLLRGGETVATERNLKDGRGFRHCHKHGLPRGMKVNEKALSEPCSSFTHT